jgi:ParB family chromosome partitioning protein
MFPRDRDAFLIGVLYRKVCNSMISAVADLDTIGRKLIAKKDELGHGNWIPWLRAHEGELGFGPRAAQFLMEGSRWLVANAKLASHLDEAAATEIVRRFWGKTSKVVGTFGTGDNTWRTPDEHIALARAVLGTIDLDPASTEAANETVKAAKIFTEEDDGLKHTWCGNVFLNPPYSQPLIARFVSKLVGEYKAGSVIQAILLTHNFTDTSWFHEAATAAAAGCFTLGRVLFYKANGKIANPTQGQIFLYFGENVEAFRREFSTVGLVTRLD